MAIIAGRDRRNIEIGTESMIAAVIGRLLCNRKLWNPGPNCSFSTLEVWPAPGSEDTELGVSWSWRWVMERRKFTREFKLEAVRLIKERGVSYVQAAQEARADVFDYSERFYNPKRRTRRSDI
jgi:hypothetical protein